MKEKIKSELTGEEYPISDILRLVNQKQVLFYWLSGCKPVDIYPSVDFKTNAPIFVYLYLRSETADLYKKWCDREVDWEALINENNIS